MRNIEFTKIVATGNDFVIIEDRVQSTENRKFEELAKKICDRKYGIGADGMLLLEKTAKADIRMRIFNPDGSEAEMCGNGARCCAKYYSFKLSALSYQPIKIETKSGILEAIVNDDIVKLKMSDPKGIKANYINTGVPHAVIFVDDLENTDVDGLGRKIRNSKEFAPAGANVDFVKIIDKDTIAVRTYERGVEAETLACGTGAVASAIITEYREQSIENRNKIDVKTRSGETLKVYFEKNRDKISNVWLEGTAKIVYTGGFNYDS